MNHENENGPLYTLQYKLMYYRFHCFIHGSPIVACDKHRYILKHISVRNKYFVDNKLYMWKCKKAYLFLRNFSLIQKESLSD